MSPSFCLFTSIEVATRTVWNKYTEHRIPSSSIIWKTVPSTALDSVVCAGESVCLMSSRSALHRRIYKPRWCRTSEIFDHAWSRAILRRAHVVEIEQRSRDSVWNDVGYAAASVWYVRLTRLYCARQAFIGSSTITRVIYIADRTVEVAGAQRWVWHGHAAQCGVEGQSIHLNAGLRNSEVVTNLLTLTEFYSYKSL